MCDLRNEECSQVWNNTTRMAKKEHTCECCGRLIAPREKYTRTFSLHDGYAQSWKSCRECARDIAAFGKEHHFYPAPDYFDEYLQRCIYEGDNARRWDAMRRRIKARSSAR